MHNLKSKKQNNRKQFLKFTTMPDKDIFVEQLKKEPGICIVVEEADESSILV